MPDNSFLPAFHFNVQFSGLKGDRTADSAFESVCGLQVTATTGNDKKQSSIFNPVILKRAVRQQHSPLREWVLLCLNGNGGKPLPEMLMQVLDETHQPAVTIRLKQVTAEGWQLAPLQAQQNELLMEEITLCYRSLDWMAS
ncbi:MAG: phage tail protein [Ferruginibacter sp.]